MKVVLFIRSLGYGGAERQLVTLAKALTNRGHMVVVAVFYPGGAFEEELRAAGISIRLLRKRGRWDLAGFLLRVKRVLDQDGPDVLYSFLPVANVIAIAMKSLFPRIRIVVGKRASYVDLERYDWLTGISYRVEHVLERFADLVIFNSRAGMESAIASGLRCEKALLVNNGIDTELFAPDAEARTKIRAAWRIEDGHVLIGLVGRLDPMKDHRVFLEAAARLIMERDDVCFVCVGTGPEIFRKDLKRLGDELRLGRRLIWAGERSDMPAVTNALDIACSTSSYGEGFSNTLAEAMACGVPCVATDVGDSARIVGSTGEIVSPRDSAAFADGLRCMLDRLHWQPDVGQAARAHILEHFGIPVMAELTCSALEQLCGNVPE